MTHNSYRRTRLVERVTDGPITAPRWAHHVVRVLAGALSAAAFLLLAGFPWYAAWIPNALLIVASRFVSIEWYGWRPFRAHYVGPHAGTVAASLDFLAMTHTGCALVLNVFGGLVVVGGAAMPHEPVRWLGLVVLAGWLVRAYWRACPISEP